MKEDSAIPTVIGVAVVLGLFGIPHLVQAINAPEEVEPIPYAVEGTCPLPAWSLASNQGKSDEDSWYGASRDRVFEEAVHSAIGPFVQPWVDARVQATRDANGGVFPWGESTIILDEEAFVADLGCSIDQSVVPSAHVYMEEAREILWDQSTAVQALEAPYPYEDTDYGVVEDSDNNVRCRAGIGTGGISWSCSVSS